MVLLVKKEESALTAAEKIKWWLCPTRWEQDDFGWGEYTLLRVRRRIPWQRLARMTKQNGVRILPEEGIVLSADIPAFRQRPSLKERFFVPSIELLSSLTGSASGRRIVLADEEGQFFSWVRLLLPYAAQIRIVTRAEERASQLARQLLEEEGAAILVGTGLPAEKALVLDPLGWLPVMPRSKNIHLCAEEKAGGLWFCPSVREGILPKGFDRWCLWEAFHPETGEEGPSNFYYSAVWQGKESPIRQAAREISSKLV